jgi:hypothetical protein
LTTIAPRAHSRYIIMGQAIAATQLNKGKGAAIKPGRACPLVERALPHHSW